MEITIPEVVGTRSAILHEACKVSQKLCHHSFVDFRMIGRIRCHFMKRYAATHQTGLVDVELNCF